MLPSQRVVAHRTKRDERDKKTAAKAAVFLYLSVLVQT